MNEASNDLMVKHVVMKDELPENCWNCPFWPDQAMCVFRMSRYENDFTLNVCPDWCPLVLESDT